MVRLPTALMLIWVLVSACTAGHAPSPDARGEVPAVREVRNMATGIAVPWGVDFLPDGDALVAERDTARILRVRPDGTTTSLGTVPGAAPGEPNGEGGLLGLAISPHFTVDHAVFVYNSTPVENSILRITLDQDRLGAPQPLITGIPASTLHDGGRLVFGPDGMLYIGTGDAKRAHLAQDTRSLAGKILRVTPGGTPAPGNPFDDSPVYSYGHRNVQGLAFDKDGRLWVSEHGEHEWDELNLIHPGGNYGWPFAEGRDERQGFINPAAQWLPAEASPSGIAIVGDAVYMAALRGERLWRIPISGDRAGRPEEFFRGQYGRLRSVNVAPDGSLWIATSNRDGRGEPRPGDDRIVKLVAD